MFDATPPRVAGVVRQAPASQFINASNVMFRVTFNEPVQNVDAADFTVNAGTLGDVAQINSTTYDVPIDGLNAFEGTLTLGFAGGQNVQDLSTNALANTTPTGLNQTYTLDHVAPTISSIIRSTSFAAGGPITFTITYADTNVGTSSLSASNVHLNTAGSAGGLLSFDGANGATRTVTIDNITGDGMLGISIDSDSAVDLAGNLAGAAGPIANVVVDNTRPTVSIGQPSSSLTAGGPITFTITYADIHFDQSTLGTGDITLNTTGTANASVSLDGGTGTTRTVTLTNITGDGWLGISIDAGSASDQAGNLSSSAGPSETFIVDNTRPQVEIGEPAEVGGGIRFSVLFTDFSTVAGNLSASNVHLNTTGTGTGTLSFESVSPAFWTVLVTPVSGSGSVSISIDGGAATDLAGNPSEAAGPSTQQLVHTMTAIAEDVTAPVGTRVGTFLAGHLSDNEGGANPGIAVIHFTGNGRWQYSANGSTWIDFGGLANPLVRLLSTNHQIRFVPAVNWTGQASLVYRAWDGTLGVAGGTLPLLVVGGASPFSAETGIVTSRVTPTNDAPLWTTPSLSAPVVDKPNVIAAGQTTAAFAEGAFRDVDGDPFAGVAVVGLTGTGGTWQFSVDDGANWTNFGAVSATTTPVLAGADRVRFLPVAGFIGKPTIQMRAWDGSDGTAGSLVNLTGTGKTGGRTAFSANVLTVTTFVNAAPTLGSIIGPALVTSEDKTSLPVTVAALLTSAQAADANAGTVLGAALVGASGPGAWQYSTDGGTLWMALGVVSDSSARLLPGTAKLRFVPAKNQTGQATLEYRARDRAVGVSGSMSNISAVGGATAFSEEIATAKVAINAVNDSPTWTKSSASAPLLDDQNALAMGILIADVCGGGLFSDADGDSVGVAVGALSDTTNGLWEFSRDDGDTWTPFGAVAVSTARLLTATDRIHFIANPNFNAKVSVQLRAWDGITGTPGGTADLSGTGKTGGATAFSANVLTVTSFTNAAPMLGSPAGPSLNTSEDTASAPVTVASLLVPALATDEDPGTILGVAIVGATGSGSWQYSTDNGATWKTLGSVSSSSARLLPSTAKLRFAPTRDQNGQATLQYRAWDRTNGSAGAVFNITHAGGATAFSDGIATATLNINPVNDAPVINPNVKPVLTPILPDNDNPPADPVAILLSGVTDADPDALGGIAITALTGLATGRWDYSLDDGSSWQTVGLVSKTSALLLRDTDRIRYVPNLGFRGSAALTFKAWDQTTGSAGATQTPTGNAFSLTTTVASVLVNTAPVLFA